MSEKHLPKDYGQGVIRFKDRGAIITTRRPDALTQALDLLAEWRDVETLEQAIAAELRRDEFLAAQGRGKQGDGA